MAIAVLPVVRRLRLLGYSLEHCPDAPWWSRWCVWQHAQDGPLQEDGSALVEARPAAVGPWRWPLAWGWGHLLRTLPLRLPELA